MAHDRITVDPRIMFGKPVIKGTRIPAELILRKLGEGMTDEQIIQQHPNLTVEDIRAAAAASPSTTAVPHHIAQWCDVMNAAEQFLLAGLQREVGPAGDVASAYRHWNERQADEHDRAQLTMLENLHRREKQHGR